MRHKVTERFYRLLTVFLFWGIISPLATARSQVIHHRADRGRAVDEFSVSPNGEAAAVLTLDGKLWILNISDTAIPAAGPVASIRSADWSPDGRWLIALGERPGDNAPSYYMWDTLWLLDPGKPAERKDLLPAGSLFKMAGRRSIEDAAWLDDGHVYFSIACGTSCIGHFIVNVADGDYSLLCISSGRFAWAPNRKIAIAENPGNGISEVGLGLVKAEEAVALRQGSSPFRYDRECKSAFSGSPRTDGPGEYPVFVAWLPDSRHVLYENGRDNSLHIWDTVTGHRPRVIPGTSR